ncbi:hypothetical protein JVU11DRAFT_9014 [Chiua virens]|nr:hypothetical protein JVU11DRAFT_9014 [Chiua virens]
MLSIAARRAPATLSSRAAFVRTYTSSSRDGSVAQSKEFGKKERAHEGNLDESAQPQESDILQRNTLVRHDAELLRKLKSDIEEKKKQIVRRNFS